MAVYLYIAPEEWLWGEKENHFPSGTRQVPSEPKPSLSTRSAVKYGYDIGLRRLRDIFAERDVKVTLWVGGAAAEQHPDILRELADLGHEISAHSYSQGKPLSLMGRDEQRETIRRTRDILMKVTGQRPLGWIGPGAVCNEDTIELLAEEGYVYHADLQDDELPYFIDTGSRTLVEIPYRFVGNFNDFVVGPPVRSVNETIDYLKAGFDAYYREAAVRPVQFNFGTHPFVSGRPDTAYVLAQFIDYVRSHDDVWLATYREIADWWTQQFAAGYPV
jgi:peptidoglycan/xylan/chitin deacetylase (PgdA/CDA1 family)